MSVTKLRVALVAGPDDTRISLAAYLNNAGFDGYECDELSLPSASERWSCLPSTGDVLVRDTRSLIKSSKGRRVVVVTSTPNALKDLIAIHLSQLRVLAAPVFGWDVVDGLRTSEPARPRGA